MNEAEEDAFKRAASAADDRLAREMFKFADKFNAPGLSAANKFMATIVGAQTAVLRSLKECCEVYAIDDRQQFEVLLREISNVWGQLHHEPATGPTRQ